MLLWAEQGVGWGGCNPEPSLICYVARLAYNLLHLLIAQPLLRFSMLPFTRYDYENVDADKANRLC